MVDRVEELVSVVIPVYNAEDYLDRCIESVTGQTYRNTEIILVDDGSADGSGAICDSWADRDPRVRVIHKENAGAGMARNTGIQLASGRFVFFVDSDDYMDPVTIEGCVKLSLENGADVVMFGRNDVYSDGRVEPLNVKTDRLFFEGDEVLSDVMPGLFTYERGFGISVWGKMFPLSLIKDNGILFRSERALISEDAFFILELFAHVDSVAILAENLYFYVKNENSFSRSYKDGHQALNDAFLTESVALCEGRGYPERVRNCVMSRYHTYALVGMKQIISSDLTKKEKKKALRAVYDNSLLHSTLTDEVLVLDIRPSRIFWRFFRKKCYLVCYLMLCYKARR